jgi:hypothetical protein
MLEVKPISSPEREEIVEAAVFGLPVTIHSKYQFAAVPPSLRGLTASLLRQGTEVPEEMRLVQGVKFHSFRPTTS